MRRSLIFATLFLAGCATRPQQPVQQTPIPEPVSTETRQLLGRTVNELVGQFGRPALQVQEGSSLKLQFRDRSCVLDAYLYPSTGGQLRVTHIDTRSPTGGRTDQTGCVLALENPS